MGARDEFDAERLPAKMGDETARTARIQARDGGTRVFVRRDGIADCAFRSFLRIDAVAEPRLVGGRSGPQLRNKMRRGPRWCFGKTRFQTFLDAMPMTQEKLIAVRDRQCCMGDE